MITRINKSMAELEEGGWKPVEEVALSGREPPACYIQREEDRPTTDASLPPTPVPVVDLSRLLQPSDGNDEADKLRSALHSWGFFQVIGHDLSASLLDEVHNITRKFFQLPMGIKQKYSNQKFRKDFAAGYGNDHAAAEDQVLNWAERLVFLVEPKDEREPELWPEDPISFRDIINEYTMKTKNVTEHLVKAMAKLLGLNEDYFINLQGDRARVSARFNYYPSCPRPDLVFGFKPHSDNSMITIILPDKDVDGLEVLKDNEWVKVHTLPHALLINLGDEMEIISNGIFKSPVHRVMPNLEKERISAVLFYHLDPEKELGPATGLVNDKEPILYKTMKTKEYREVFYQNYIKGKRTIDWVKI